MSGLGKLNRKGKMSYKQIITNLKRYHQRLNGSTVEYELSFYQNYLQDIKRLSLFFKKRSDDQIRSASRELIDKAIDNENPDNLLIEAYAIVIEAIERILKLFIKIFFRWTGIWRRKKRKD